MNRSTAALARTAIRLAPLPLLAAVACAAQAQDQPDGRWHGGISVGGSAASGNTSTTALSVTADANKATDADKITLYSLLNYATNKNNGNSVKTAQLLRLGGRYDYNLSRQVFLFGGGEGETNKPAGLDSKYDINGGAGYRVIRSPDTSFDVFGGVGYAKTSFTNGRTRKGAELLLGEESSHKLSDTSTFKQRLVYYPGASDLGNRATFDASLATAIVGGWTLNTGLAVRYASKVEPGLKSTDTLLTVGFGYKY